MFLNFNYLDNESKKKDKRKHKRKRKHLINEKIEKYKYRKE